MNVNSMIRVHRNGEDLGFFTHQFALECINKGVLQAEDWAFCDGLADWTCLGELFDIKATPAKITPPPIIKKSIIEKSRPFKPNSKTQQNKLAIALFCIAVFIVISFFANRISNPQPAVVNSTDSTDAESAGVIYYETQIKQGIMVVEPNHQFTADEEAMIHNSAVEENKQHPK